MQPAETTSRIVDERRRTDQEAPPAEQHPMPLNPHPVGRPWAGRAGAATVAELSVGLFCLAVLAFSPPLLVIFSTQYLLFGIPLLYVYLFVTWGLVIVLLARLARRAHRTLTIEKEHTALPPERGPTAPGRAEKG